MIRLRRVFACAAVVLAALVADPAFANAHEFIILNAGHHTVVEAHAMTVVKRFLLGEKGWGANILGKAELAPGVEMHFDSPKDRGGCKQDFKFIYSDGHVARGSAMDVCTFGEIRLRY